MNASVASAELSQSTCEQTSICNDGRIVGNGFHDGALRGFVLVPLP